MTRNPVQVAAGIIRREDSQGERFFITRRHAKQHQGNKWEFPGGKVEQGETPEESLSRELFEEIGIKVISSTLLTRIEHDYGDKVVHLMFYIVDVFEGQPTGLEGQEAAWVTREELLRLKFPEANRPILSLL
ncbi:MAG: 8-oxo-dGTP diphosphatase MutT [Pseudomonadota bacterium]